MCVYGIGLECWCGLCAPEHGVFVQLPVFHILSKTFKLNRLFGYLSHHRICTWFPCSMMCFSSSCCSACVSCSSLLFLLSFARLVFWLRRSCNSHTKFSMNSRWRVTEHHKTIVLREKASMGGGNGGKER